MFLLEQCSGSVAKSEGSYRTLIKSKLRKERYQKAGQFIPEEDQATDKPNKMLGMIFDAMHDTMTIGIPKPPEGKPNKRMLQSFLARIYDPMGVLSPLTHSVQLSRVLLGFHDSTGMDNYEEIIEMFCE
uniref:Uncharacterized protein n=2 Tax=Caenorhabditis japonica TaxID=281687 RepID=A0A8R1E045_CAEJA